VITLDLPFRATPRPPTKRAKSRTVAQFAGAGTTRLTSDWHNVSLLSADRETRGNLRILRGRSRQFYRDNPHIAGLVQSLQDEVMGPGGIGINPRMRLPRGELLVRDNLRAWEAWKRWSRRGTCTVDGMLHFAGVQRLALATWFVDGEVFIRELAGFDNEFGYALQFLDADQLDESFHVPATAGQNEITQGVEIDRWGRPVAYHFWDHHPTDTAFRQTRKRIPASEVIHIYQPLRPNQHRGIPLLTPVLIALKMLDGYTQAEVTAAWVAAAQGGFFQISGEDAQALGITEDDDESDGDEDPAPIEMEAEPGLARKLPPGWTFKEWDPAHPNSSFPEFQRAMLRVIARGTNRSYIAVSGDLSDTSYSSGRQGKLSEQDGYRVIQELFGPDLVERAYRGVIRYGSLSGALILPTPEPSRWSDCTLEPRGWPWVDPKNDAETAEMELASLLNSPQRICAARGLDYEEILDEVQEAQRMCRERGIEYPTFTPRVAKAATPPTKANGNGNGNGNGAANRVADLLPLGGAT